MDEGRTTSAAWQSPGAGMPDFFEATPMALWLEDYGDLHAQFERWRAEGVTDLRSWLLQDRDRLRQCAGLIRILRVNRQALSLFGARTQSELMDRLADVLRDDTFEGLAGELDQLWRGHGGFHSQTVNYTLDGRRLDLSLKAVVLADDDRCWDRILVAMEDVTPLQEARRRAQASARDAREFFQQAPVSLWFWTSFWWKSRPCHSSISCSAKVARDSSRKTSLIRSTSWSRDSALNSARV